MKSPLKRLAVGAEPTVASAWSAKLDWDRIALARRRAGIAAAVATVVAAGTASSLFVNYLADRAIERSASLSRIAAAQTEVASGEPMESMLPETVAGGTVSGATASGGMAAARSLSAGIAAASTPRPAPAKGAAGTGAAIAAAKAGVASAGARPDRSADPATDGEQIFAYDSGDGMDGPSAAEMAAEKLAGDDRLFTSSIRLPETAPPPAPNPSAEKLAAIPVSASAGAAANTAQAGSVTRDVTMRAGPAKRAGEVGVVPAKSPVSVLGCKSWCEIVYNGKKGFVYKSFVRKS